VTNWQRCKRFNCECSVYWGKADPTGLTIDGCIQHRDDDDKTVLYIQSVPYLIRMVKKESFLDS
jgi:hypothetical protein